MQKFLIVGLGNPGQKYQNTRHNFGFIVLDYLMKKWGFNPFQTFNKSLLTHSKKVFPINLFLLKPMNFMNLSGSNVLEVINYYKIEIDNVIVIHDDKDLNLGYFKIKLNGGSGGHNGVQNIIDHLQKPFWRIKMGIGFNKSSNMAQYVLANFSELEKKEIVAICLQIEKLFVLKFEKQWSWLKINSMISNKSKVL